MAAISLIFIVWKNFKLLTPQSLGLLFSECQWKWNISIGHYEKIVKMAATSLILIVQKIFKLLTPKVWVSGFLSVDRNGISVLVIMKKIEKWLPFL